MPALERYDGVVYRVVKRLQRLGQYPQDVDLLIVSAVYGIVRPDYQIEAYDLRMTAERAVEQAQRNRVILQEVIRNGTYNEVFITAGKVYLLALEPVSAWQGAVQVTINQGKIGVQLSTLKRWLLRKKRSRLH